MVSIPLPLTASSIRFGTDGWRGVLGVDITIDRMMLVAAAASQELLYRAPRDCTSRKVVIGFDRRFLAPEFAESIASAVRACELEPLLTQTPVPTPSCSWAVVQKKALGALVVTASHNPPEWLGLKVKGSYGGSVQGDFTEAVERRLAVAGVTVPIEGTTKKFDGRSEHLDGLRKKFDLPLIAKKLRLMGLTVIVDPMHGSAAGCIPDLFDPFDKKLVVEIRSHRDPLFGGNPPEPLEPYLGNVITKVKDSRVTGEVAIGLVFDGDGDRIAAIDEDGRFCSNQLLMPLLIDHLAGIRKIPGSVVKTVSGSDLMRLVAEDLGREVIEMPVGFKHIAEEMLANEVLIGGEESGGVGFGMHLPERDALFAALMVLEALAEQGEPLGKRLRAIQERVEGFSCYERIDLRLANMDQRRRLQKFLLETPPDEILGHEVEQVIRTDGVKLRLAPSYWLMFRFSGTEPLLRIYCEAPSQEQVFTTLDWAKDLAEGK